MISRDYQKLENELSLLVIEHLSKGYKLVLSSGGYSGEKGRIELTNGKQVIAFIVREEYSFNGNKIILEKYVFENKNKYITRFQSAAAKKETISMLHMVRSCGMEFYFENYKESLEFKDKIDKRREKDEFLIKSKSIWKTPSKARIEKIWGIIKSHHIDIKKKEIVDYCFEKYYFVIRYKRENVFYKYGYKGNLSQKYINLKNGVN